MGKIEEGKKAPDFALKDSEGKLHKRDDFIGQTLVLYFYPKDNTPGCTVEACDFTHRLPDFEAAGAAVVGISPDDEISHQKFRENYKLKHLLLCDPGHLVTAKYGCWGKKKFMGKEYEGLIRSTFIIDAAGYLSRAMYGVIPAGHADGVLRALKNPRATPR